jgi:uncharacterized protein (DUF924 family)
MATSSCRWAAELVHFWFMRLTPASWFGGGPSLDHELARRFADEWRMLARQQPERFLGDPHTALAAVLLFDQIPRNIHRGTPLAYATDPLARAITRAALARGFAERLESDARRQFLAMPLMHSEAIADQRLALAFYARLPRHGWAFARAHYAMIARFGRFPHRNAALGRASSSAEGRAVAAGFAW